MRRHYLWLIFAGLICTNLAHADDRQTKPVAPPKGEVVQDLWDAAYLGPAKIGYLHTVVRAMDRDGKKFYRTSQELRLTITRYKTQSEIHMESGTVEDANGKVTEVFMTQSLQGKKLVLTGTVEDGQLHILVDRGRIDKNVPWNDEAIGLYRQEHLFQRQKVKPGDQLVYHSYEPTISTAVAVHATVKDEEEVDVLRFEKGKSQRVKERLLRVEAKPEEIKIGNDMHQLPGMVLWLNKERVPVRSELDMQPLGKIVFYRTVREAALATNGGVDLSKVDIGLKSMIPLDRRIGRPHEAAKIVYRITVKDDDKPLTVLARDARQTIENVQGKTFELHVQAIRAPRGGAKDAKVRDEFLQSCYFLDSDNAQIKAFAREAVGEETDPWHKARAIENWVHRHMQADSGVEFCPASQAAKELRGDCRQHAMLTAAMCRAAGVPSRTAVGLVYVDHGGRGPEMGFHMWTEVWIKGEWIGLDATLGRGSVGPAHIKISDSSWHDVQSLTPLLPVARALGKLSIQVIRVE